VKSGDLLEVFGQEHQKRSGPALLFAMGAIALEFFADF
jgi:hypothetical protein